MKKLSKGFTLAEVLITLGVIGIVAAITLPSLTTGHTYKTLGVKLSKIFATTEGAARAYVVSNAGFKVPSTPADVAAFANDIFVFKGDTFIKEGDVSKNYEGTTFLLKDGTEIGLTEKTDIEKNHAESFNVVKYGKPVFGFTFKPNVKGLPSSVQDKYAFVITETGYVYPGNDECLWNLYETDWDTKSSKFTNEKDESGNANACYASKIAKNDGQQAGEKNTTEVEKK